MKKKILFIMESLRIGGAEKSLITILSMIDYNKYDVDLYLFKPTGEFMEFLPKEVNLLKSSDNYAIFSKSRKLAPINFLLKLDFKRLFHSFIYLIKCLFYKIKGKLYIGWEHVTYMFDKIDNEYDASISFLERKCIYFNIDKVKSKKKIGFIHNDYNKYPFDYKNDKKYFKDYNKIATVSEHCKEVLEDIFPEYKEKFLVIKNMVSKKMIEKMSEEELEISRESKEQIVIVTVARLVKQKGIDRAIDICKRLVDNNYNIKWYVIGQGEEETNLNKKIIQNNLKEKFILIGVQKNPYKWIKNSDIYVQPSRFEGFGITVCEAKALVKPIVASNIPEFREQIKDEINGYIATDNNTMYDKIVKIIENREGIKERFINNLKNDNSIENIEELNRLYNILEE